MCKTRSRNRRSTRPNKKGAKGQLKGRILHQHKSRVKKTKEQMPAGAAARRGPAEPAKEKKLGEKESRGY